MTTKQIIISIAGVVLVIVLYNLPKYVVENDEQEAAGQIMQSSGEQPDAAHGLAEDLKTDLSFWKSQLSTDKSENYFIFADSLVSAYLNLGYVDSAAWVAAQAMEMGDAGKAFAGNAYYRAFSFAPDVDKANALAEKTREILNEVLDENPDDLDAKTKVAMTYVSSSNPMRGILMLREVVEQDPDNREAIYNLGILSMQSGQYDKAVERFEKLVSLDTNDVQANFYLGISYLEVGEKEKARTVLEKVKQLDDDPTVLATVESYLKEIDI